MSAAHRLTRLEGGLPPRAAVLRWLGEVHGCDSLLAYLEERSEASAGVSPLVALTDRARSAARRDHAGEPRPVWREAEQRAASDIVFLVLLVVETECDAVEVVRLGSLRLEALRWELRARRVEGDRDRRGWAAWRTGVLELATDLARSDAARRILAVRYLDGLEPVSPLVLASWAELQDSVTALVDALPTVPGGRRRWRRDVAAISTVAERTAPDEASRIIERVRARTLDLLGEPDRALRIVERVRREGMPEAG